MEKLYRFSAQWARTETIEGVFVAEEADVESAYGVPGYLEEPCGKHSSGRFTLKPEHLTVLTSDADFIAKARKFGLLPIGENPLSALTCGICGDALPAPYTKCGDETCGWKRGGAS